MNNFFRYKLLLLIKSQSVSLAELLKIIKSIYVFHIQDLFNFFQM